MPYQIFVIDDDKHYARLLSYRLDKNKNYEVRTFHSGEEALNHLQDGPDVILCDIMMPGLSGIEVLKRIKRDRPHLPVIMVSAQGVVDVAVEAMKLGASDYITKGQDDLVKLNTSVRNVLEKADLLREVEDLRGEVAQQYGIEGIIGDSPAMQRVYRLIGKATRGDLTVAVMGESGTGKELVAKAIHYNSNRKQKPFVVVNCAAIPRELMESEFFGHEKGSFTGAHARKIGMFEQADGGTLFLDEVSEMDLDLQAKLLRALQQQEITRVGGSGTIRVDVRAICATNRDILQTIRDGRFREDLYYRLFQFPVQLPPLRERGQDILLLARHFLEEYKEKHEHLEDKHLSPEARRAILEHHWPGNVRELKSTVERALLMADGDAITVDDLMLHDRVHIAPWNERMTLADAAGRREAERPAERSAAVAPPTRQSLADAAAGAPQPERPAVSGIALDGADDGEPEIASIEELKQRAVERAYRLCEGNVDKAAVELGIGRATMYRLLKKYDIKD